MQNNYIEDLAAWADKRATKKRRIDASVVAFLAVKSDVQAAIDAGYSLTTIWEHLHETGKLKCCYETFRKHVRKHIKNVSADQATSKQAANADKAKQAQSNNRPEHPQQKSQTEKKEPASIIGGFKFNPIPNPDELF